MKRARQFSYLLIFALAVNTQAEEHHNQTYNNLVVIGSNSTDVLYQDCTFRGSVRVRGESITDIRFVDCVFDGQNLDRRQGVNVGIEGDVSSFIFDGCDFINYNAAGLQIRPRAGTAPHHFTIVDCFFGAPDGNAEGRVPIKISRAIIGEMPHDFVMERVEVRGPGLPLIHANRNVNNATADQFTLQGVYNVVLKDCVSTDGGENGISLTWGSYNVLVDNCMVANCEGNGLHCGAPFAIINVTNSNQWGQNFAPYQGGMIGSEKVNFSNGAKGRIRGVRVRPDGGQDLYVISITGRRLVGGVTMEHADGRQSQVLEVNGNSSDLHVQNCELTGLGINNAFEAGSQYSGVLSQQADISIEGTVVRGFDTGLNASNATIARRTMEYESNGINERSSGNGAILDLAGETDPPDDVQLSDQRQQQLDIAVRLVDRFRLTDAERAAFAMAIIGEENSSDPVLGVKESKQLIALLRLLTRWGLTEAERFQFAFVINES